MKQYFDAVKRYLTGAPKLPADFDPAITEIIANVKEFTLTSPERIFALCEAVKYLVAHQIPGDIVECGVWKGGSMMAVAQTLINLGKDDRHLYLFDTFEGMSTPNQKDVDYLGTSAFKMLKRSRKKESSSVWCYAPLEDVKAAVLSVGYPSEKIHFIQGKVEDTVPENAPQQIALLRLDTDWYTSTKHELIHLFPRLVSGGVLIIDDYGHWQGARQAVDEYFQENKSRILLNRIDYTGRIGVVYHE